MCCAQNVVYCCTWGEAVEVKVSCIIAFHPLASKASQWEKGLRSAVGGCQIFEMDDFGGSNTKSRLIVQDESSCRGRYCTYSMQKTRGRTLPGNGDLGAKGSSARDGRV